jgi:ubiquitin-protein ligase
MFLKFNQYWLLVDLMSSINIRRDEDVAKLKALEHRTGGKIRVLKTNGNPISVIDIQIEVRTSSDASYPQKSIGTVNARINLAVRYPFEAPVISLNTTVFNPNIYPSGKVCLGSKWLPTEFLDLLVLRLFKILAFDETIINVASPANGAAAVWYQRAKRDHPKEFPSDSITSGATQSPVSMKWADVKAQNVVPERIIVSCPQCRAKLRIPSGKSGNVSCPTCSHLFMVQG